MNRSILLTAVVFCITTTYSFAQTEESRYENAAGNLVVKWSDGKTSTYGKDPTGKEDLEVDPKVAERLYDAHGNRREITHDGRTRIIERQDDQTGDANKKADKPAREASEKADKPKQSAIEDSHKHQVPK